MLSEDACSKAEELSTFKIMRYIRVKVVKSLCFKV